MKQLFDKHAKLLYLILGVLAFAVLISGLFFMTQYRFVRVNFVLDNNNLPEFTPTASLNGANQQALYSFLNRFAQGTYATELNKLVGKDGIDQGLVNSAIEFINSLSVVKDKMSKEAAEKISGITWALNYDSLLDIKNFKASLDAYNNTIIVFSIVSLICFAGLLALGNGSRNIYYKSNLIGGLLLSLVIVVFAVVMIINSFSLMGKIKDNYELYNIVSVLQNSENELYSHRVKSSETIKYAQYLTAIKDNFTVNSASLVAYDVIFGVVAGYAVFLMIGTVVKYNGCAERRKQVIKNAGLAGEQA
jgi:hypothetical protein